MNPEEITRREGESELSARMRADIMRENQQLYLAEIKRKEEERAERKRKKRAGLEEKGKRFFDLKSKGFTLQQIGDLQEPPITRERVRQIIAACGYPALTKATSIGSKYVRVPCASCGQLTSSFFNKDDGKQHRHRYCKKYKMGAAVHWKEKKKILYKTDPEYRAQISATSARWYARLKNDPVRYANHLQKQREYLRTYKRKKKGVDNSLA